MELTTRESLLPVEAIQQRILAIRGQRVMLSTDLAALYGVEPRALVQAVKRNLDRFPPDFMFQLTKEEYNVLRSQTVTLEAGRGQHSKYPPYAFTEQGVAMLSSVLRSAQAVQVNIAIMRAFVRLRKVMATHVELAQKLHELEDRITEHDDHIAALFEAIEQLMLTPEMPGRRIGFREEHATEEISG